MKMVCATSTLALALGMAATPGVEAAVIADLEADYTEAGAVAGVTQFSENGWSFSDGTSPLLFDDNLLEDFAPATSSGFSGSEVIFGVATLDSFPFVTTQGIFDGNAPGAGQLNFHPGTATSVVITWTADQAYNDVALDYDITRPVNADPAGLAVGGTAGAVLAPTDYNNTPLVGQILVGDIAAGETIVITISNGSDGSPGGDQSFGNFVISDNVPEPSSLALLGLAGLLVARRRRA